MATGYAERVPPELKGVVEEYELDLALDTPSSPLDLEVDGVHHTDTRGRHRRRDLARDQILESTSWRVLRVPAWQCLAEWCAWMMPSGPTCSRLVWFMVGATPSFPGTHRRRTDDARPSCHAGGRGTAVPVLVAGTAVPADYCAV